MKFLTLFLLLIGCNNPYRFYMADLPPVGKPSFVDEYIIISRAVIYIQNGQIVSHNRYKPVNLLDLILPKALAYTAGTPSASINISYTNVAATSFNLTAASILSVPTLSVDGLTLNLGNIDLNTLDDNKLKVCSSVVGTQAVSGTSKCNTAAIRVYAVSGDASGVFCNTAESYCIPMKVNGNTFGIGVANAQIPLTYTIPASTNRLLKSQLGTTTFPLTVDMTNAGEGSFSSSVVVEYILKR